MNGLQMRMVFSLIILVIMEMASLIVWAGFSSPQGALKFLSGMYSSDEFVSFHEAANILNLKILHGS